MDREITCNKYIFLLTKDGCFAGKRKIYAPNAVSATRRLYKRLGEAKLKTLKVSLVQVLDPTFTKVIWEKGDENDPK